MQAELKVMEGKQRGAVIPLSVKKFLIGREEDCHLRPNSDLVSRHHCVFTIDEFTVRIRDLGSTNGTFVNGERINGQVVLKDGDLIRVGKLEFQVGIRTTVPVPAPAAAPAPAAPAGGYVPEEPSGAETTVDFAVLNEAPVDPAQGGTGIYGGDTAYIQPNKAASPKKELPPIRLPDPATTGAKSTPLDPAKVGSDPSKAGDDPRSTAADIIRQYMHKRPR